MGDWDVAQVGSSGPDEPGNIDLKNRPRVKNADGSISTVRSMSVNMDGKEVLIPTVSDDGRIMSPDEAVQNYKKTGKHLGIFKDAGSATAYAKQLHEQQAEMIAKDKPADAWSPVKVHAPGEWDVAQVAGQAKEDWISRLGTKIAPYMPSMEGLNINPQAPAKSAVSAGLETVGAVPSTNPEEVAKGVVEAPTKLSTSLSGGASAVSGKVSETLQKKGVSKGYASVAGIVASIPFDPQSYVPLGTVAEKVVNPGLTSAGLNAAENVTGSLVARTGEELLSEVKQAAQSGDVAKLQSLVESGKTNLFYSEVLKSEIGKAKQLADTVDNLTATKASLEAKTSVPLKLKNSSLKIDKVESKFTDFLAQPEGDQADSLIAKRDSLAQKNFQTPSDALEKQIKEMNQKISETVREADKSRVTKISEYRSQIADAQADFSKQQTQISNQITDTVMQREKQLQSMKTKIAGKLTAPLEKDVVEGILRLPDSGAFNRYVRAPMQGLTFLSDTLDKVSNGAFTRYVTNPQLDAEAKFDFLVKKYLDENASIYTKHGIGPDQDTSFRLFREGKAAAPKGLEQTFAAASNDYTALVKQRMEAYNAAAKRIGMKEINPQGVTSEGYVFHTKKMNALFDLNDLDMRDVPKDALFVRHNDPVFHSWKQRFNVIPEEQLAGAFEALDKYSMNIAKVEAYGEQANKFRALGRISADMGKSSLAEQFNAIADRLTGDASTTSSSGLQAATGGLAKPGLMNKINGFASIFAKNAVNSASAALGNMGASVINALYMGPRRASASIVEGMTKDLFEHVYKATIDPSYELLAKKYSKVLGIHSFERPLTFLEKNVSPARQIATLYQNTFKSFFSYMNDSMNVGTWNQSFKAARASGLSFDEAVGTADNLVMRSQAIYREAFRPSVVSSSSQLGKILAPLSTYVFNAANALSQDVIFSNLSMAKKANLLAGAAATGIITNIYTTLLSGKSKVDAGDFVPFLRSIQMGFGALAVPGQVVKDIKRGHPIRGAVKAASLLTPYGSAQIPQTMFGIESIMQGKTKGLPDSARAVVFGPAKGKYPK